MILELLGRLGRLDAEGIARARDARQRRRELAGAGPDPGRPGLRAGRRRGLRRATGPPRDRRDPRAGRRVARRAGAAPAREALHRQPDRPGLGSGAMSLELAFVSPERLYLAEQVRFLTGRHVTPVIAPLSAVERPDRGDLQRPVQGGGHGRVPRHDRRGGPRRGGAGTPPRPAPAARRATAGSSGWSTRSSSRPSAPAPATSTSSRSRTPASSASGSTACSTSCPRRRSRSFIKIISRFKILAKMDIAEKRDPPGRRHRPEDQATSGSTSGSTPCPTVYGEKMVMRILDKAAIPLDLTRPRARRAAVDRPDRVDPDARTA